WRPGPATAGRHPRRAVPSGRGDRTRCDTVSTGAAWISVEFVSPHDDPVAAADEDANETSHHHKLKRAAYEEELLTLQREVVKLQEWVKRERLKVCVLFEGRDAAGKGSTIKCITERSNPRVVRVVALDKPTERERTQWYYQRYVSHLPAGGEIVLF